MGVGRDIPVVVIMTTRMRVHWNDGLGKNISFYYYQLVTFNWFLDSLSVILSGTPFSASLIGLYLYASILKFLKVLFSWRFSSAWWLATVAFSSVYRSWMSQNQESHVKWFRCFSNGFSQSLLPKDASGNGFFDQYMNLVHLLLSFYHIFRK